MLDTAKNAVERRQQEEAVLSKATLRAAEHLDVSGQLLSQVIGVSPSSVSRMKAGQFVLSRKEKAFELAALFVRLFRGLDAISGGDDETSRGWMVNENSALRGRPIDLVKGVAGLNRVVMYVDAQRAKT